MKVRTPEQLKGQVRSFSGKRGLQPQEVLQMFLMERVLERISKSKYAWNFVLKGGLLISSMVGVNERTTTDIDTTITGISMDEKEIERVIKEIISIDVYDGITFEFIRIDPIRDDDDYNNYRVHLVGHYGKIASDMKIDITTGDVITPRAIDYSYRTILDGDEIYVRAYNRETIIAEKYETIIRRNIGSTRARDFYDLHMFYSISKDEIDFDMLKAAVSRTSQRRNSQKELAEWADICDEMKHDTTLMRLWDNYRKNNQYASEVSYEEVIHAVEEIGKRISD